MVIEKWKVLKLNQMVMIMPQMVMITHTCSNLINIYEEGGAVEVDFLVIIFRIYNRLEHTSCCLFVQAQVKMTRPQPRWMGKLGCLMNIHEGLAPTGDTLTVPRNEWVYSEI
jgi:hypothetical protein